MIRFILILPLFLSGYAASAERTWPRFTATAEEARALLSLVASAKKGTAVSDEIAKSADKIFSRFPKGVLTGKPEQKAATALLRFGYFPCDLSAAKETPAKRPPRINLFGEQHALCDECHAQSTKLTRLAGMGSHIFMREGIGYGAAGAKTGAAENLKRGEVGSEDLDRYGIVGFFKNRTSLHELHEQRLKSRDAERAYLIAAFLALRAVMESPELTRVWNENAKDAKFDAATSDLAKIFTSILSDRSMKPLINGSDSVFAKEASLNLVDFIANAVVKDFSTEEVRARLDLPELDVVKSLVKNPKAFTDLDAFLNRYAEAYRDEALFYNLATEVCANGIEGNDVVAVFGARHLINVHRFIKEALKKAEKPAIELVLDRGILEHAHMKLVVPTGNKEVDAAESAQREELLEFFKANK